MLILKRMTLCLICLTILVVAPFAYAQETQPVLKPNQLITFSLAPRQEKLFVLQMKKGDFADIQSLAREGLNLSFEIYDSARTELLEKSTELLEKSYEGNGSIWFVAPSDGDFILVCKLAENQYDKISGAQKISIQYNNKFKLPPGTKLKAIRKANGFDVKIMTTEQEESYGYDDEFLLIEKNGQFQKARKLGNLSVGFYFDDGSGDGDFNGNNSISAKEKRSIQLIKTTVDKTGDGIADIMIVGMNCGASGRYCSTFTYFIDLGDAAKISELIDLPGSFDGLVAIGKNPKGGLRFEARREVYFGSPLVILEFRNGILRPNFDLMKKPPPSIAVLRSKAKKFRNQLSLKPYKGIDNEDSVLYKEDWDENKSGFEDVMLDLIFSGNEDLAWQFLDLVWSPQKRGKELFIRDFKNQLLQSPYWQMILEDRKK